MLVAVFAGKEGAELNISIGHNRGESAPSLLYLYQITGELMKYVPFRHIWTDIEGEYISMVLKNMPISRPQKTSKTPKIVNLDVAGRYLAQITYAWHSMIVLSLSLEWLQMRVCNDY